MLAYIGTPHPSRRPNKQEFNSYSNVEGEDIVTMQKESQVKSYAEKKIDSYY